MPILKFKVTAARSTSYQDLTVDLHTYTPNQVPTKYNHPISNTPYSFQIQLRQDFQTHGDYDKFKDQIKVTP